MKTILFDLDDTIFDFKASERVAILRTMEQMGIEPSQELPGLYSQINDHLWKLLEKGEITREQLLPRRFEQLFAQLGIDRSGQVAQGFYEQNLSQQAHLVDGALETLQSLAGEYELYLVTNGTASVQERRIAIAGLGSFFRQVFISQRLGYPKPQRAFFERCFAAIPGFEREQTVIVGDSLSSDMLGGINAGIATCWFNPGGLPRPEGMPIDRECRALPELPGILRQME